MSIKHKYFRDRNFQLDQNNSRDYMAQREMETISLLLKYFYDFNFCEGLNILDLGAGDKLETQASQTSSIDVFASILEIT